MSQADHIFIETCRKILNEGQLQTTDIRAHWTDGEPAATKKLFAVINRYDLTSEFPLLTVRPINYRAAIDEILWIWQKKSNQLKDLNSKIWNQWAREDGTIGKAYGYQLAKKHRYPEGDFDQVDRVIYDLRHNPGSRRIVTSMFNFEDLHDMALYPCAYSMTFNVVGNKLNGILNQRSQDMLVANGWNVVQYAALLHMFAHTAELEVGELVHVIADAHIYDRHISLVEELIERPTYPAPHLEFNPTHRDFYQYKVEDFVISDYQHGDKMTRIPVAV